VIGRIRKRPQSLADSRHPAKASGVNREQGGTFPDGDLLDINLLDSATLL
jgi:hypothetical protein